MKNTFRLSKYFRFLRVAGFCMATVIFFVPLAGASGEGASPQETLNVFMETLRSMEFPVTDIARHGELVKKADAFLDLDAMGQASIRQHWEQVSVEERREFLKLLWKQIENIAYRTSHDFLGDLKVTYPETHADSKGFVVKSVVHREEAALDGEVIYHLHQKEGQWKIDDVILDGVSIIEDLKYQFDKIIRDSSFTGLLARMQERLDEVEKENQGDSS